MRGWLYASLAFYLLLRNSLPCVVCLTKPLKKPILVLFRYGGVLVSTWEIRQRRHAEDGSLAS